MRRDSSMTSYMCLGTLNYAPTLSNPLKYPHTSIYAQQIQLMISFFLLFVGSLYCPVPPGCGPCPLIPTHVCDLGLRSFIVNQLALTHLHSLEWCLTSRTGVVCPSNELCLALRSSVALAVQFLQDLLQLVTHSRGRQQELFDLGNGKF